MTTKRLMLVIPEMAVGGAQRSLAKLSIEFARYFHVFLVVFNNERNVFYPVGGEVYSLDVHPRNNLISKGFAFKKRINRLRELKKELDIDVSLSFLEGADYINVLSKGREKVVLSIRGSKLHDENLLNYFFWLRSNVLIPWLYKKADAVVVVNEGIAIELKKHHKLAASKIVTIGNFYDTETIVRLSYEAKEAKIKGLYNKKILVTSGRLSVEKGIAGLISIFHELKKRRDDIILMIIGDGPEKEALFQHAIDKGLKVADKDLMIASPDVVFMGLQQNVFKYLRDSSLYLMNSSSEGFPNGLVEAMICDVPVVSSNCPYGPAEILAPGLPNYSINEAPLISRFGVLMPVQSGNRHIDTWVSMLSDLLDQEDLRTRLSAAAFERTSDFDQDLIVKQWLEVIEV